MVDVTHLMIAFQRLYLEESEEITRGSRSYLSLGVLVARMRLGRNWGAWSEGRQISLLASSSGSLKRDGHLAKCPVHMTTHGSSVLCDGERTVSSWEYYKMGATTLIHAHAQRP